MSSRGFLSSLFDLSFTSLVTTKVIKLIYVLSMIAIGLVALGFVVGAFQESAGLGIVTLLIFAPLAALFYLIYVRVFLEVVIALFRIMETNVELRDLAVAERAERHVADRPSTPPPPPPSGPLPA